VTTSLGVTLQMVKARWKKPAGAVGVAAGGDEHVDDLPVLVDGAVDVAPDTVDLDLRLIHEPPITGERRANLAASANSGVNRYTPAVDRDVIDLDTAL
jgi:hypothetical protein